MRHAFIFLFSLLIIANNYSFASNFDVHFTKSDLSNANTALNCDYLNKNEIKLIQIINLARVYPVKFSKYYLNYLKKENYSGYQKFKKKDKYYYGLYKDLLKLKKVKLEALKPSKTLHLLAYCWANKSGKKGKVGHNNGQCKGYYSAECCSYASTSSPIYHTLSLLVDESVANLGHRKSLFAPYSEIGVSFQPHKNYGTVLVIDLI